MRLSRTAAFTALAVIIAGGLYFRLLSIRTYSPNPDEFHWVSRSEKLLERYTDGELSRLTNHLGHPGIPPTVMMAIFEYYGDRWNEFMRAERGTARFIDHLSASRLSNLVWFILIVPLAFFGLRRIIGDPPALLAAALISFDTQHIVNTRIAHIDGALTLLTLCCVILYFESQARRSLYLKMIAGLAWGLCLSVKPTAVALLAGFVLTNATWRIAAKKVEQPDAAPPLIAWSDVLAAIIGIVTLASLHTRFWDPNSRFLRVHHINPPICEWISAIGNTVQSMSPFSEILATTVFLLAILCWHRGSALPRYQRFIPCLPLLFVVALIVGLLGWFPTVASNLIRYFYWISGLAELPHRAYGVTDDPSTGGYLRIWLSRTSPWLVIGSIVSALLVIAELRKPGRWQWLHNHRELVSFLLIAAAWTVFLGSSPKQAYRYILPVTPLFIAFAAWGTVRSGDLFTGGFISKRPFVGVMLLVFPQLIPVISVKPDYGLYFTSYTGGLAGAMKAGASIQPVRYEQALERANTAAADSKQPLIFEVAGDFNLLLAAYRRAFLPNDRHLKIVSYQSGLGSDWLLNFPYFSRARFKDLNQFSNLAKHSEFSFDGGTIYELYQVNPLPADIRIRVPFAESGRETGKIYVDKTTDQSALELDADDDRAGLGLFGIFFKVMPVRVTLEVTAALHELRQSPHTEIMRIAISPACSREISISDFGAPPTADSYRTFKVVCDLAEPTRIEPTLFWFANQSVLVKEVAVEIR